MSGHVMNLQLVSVDKIPGEGFHPLFFFSNNKEKRQSSLGKISCHFVLPFLLAGMQMRGVGVQPPSRDVT